MQELNNWDLQVRSFIASRLPTWPHAQAYYLELWQHHLHAKLAGEHFVKELTSGDNGKFSQRVWEMHLGRHLIACGLEVTSAPEGEPDFRFVYNGVVVWVEAVSPLPGPDLPQSWLKHDPAQRISEVQTVPHEAILLRWTTAFSAKAKQVVKYRENGVVKDNDAYVIAIDGNQLGKISLSHGHSGYPYIVEATLAIGPLALKFDAESCKLEGVEQTVRFAVEKKNGSFVPTGPFFRPDYVGVSAVLGCCAPMFGEPILPVQIAYNPLANAPLLSGVLGRDAEEYVVTLCEENEAGQEWEITRLR